MTTTSERLAALRNAMKTKDGQTVVSSPTKPKKGQTKAEKLEVQPLPISVLTAKAFTGNEKSLYSSDPQLEAKFRALATELSKESQLSQFTTALFRVDQAIGGDPTVITQLSVDAIKAYCQACKRLVADPSGAKHTEQLAIKLKDQKTDELVEALKGDVLNEDDFYID